MSDPAALLVRAVARTLAENRRVLLADASFETLAALAELGVKELVLVTPAADPNAPAGETASGAPLRMRPDWRERAHSKDLIIDPSGVAPPAEVLRILKKYGVYLTGTRSPALEAMTHVHALRGDWVHALVAANRPAQVWPLSPPYAEGPTVYLASKVDPPMIPSVICTMPAQLAPAAVDQTALASLESQAAEDAAAAQDAIEAAQDAQEAAQDAQEAAQDALEAAQDARAQAQRDHQAALEVANALKARLDEVEGALGVARGQAAATAGAATELAELEQSFLVVRAELAERRVTDRRAEAQSTRFEAARAAMSAEVAALKLQLRDTAAPAEDVQTLLTERDSARAAARRNSTLASLLLTVLAPEHPCPAAPPPNADSDALAGWCASAEAIARRAQTNTEARLAEYETLEAQHSTLVQQRRELAEAVAVLQAEGPGRATPAALPAPKATALQNQLRALEATLDAERALRVAERNTYQARLTAADDVLHHRDGLHAQLAEARRVAARARLSQAAREEASRRYETELSLRARRIDDLEALLQAHTQMRDLLNDALQTAEGGRDEAEAGRRLADENLRILKAELARARH